MDFQNAALEIAVDLALVHRHGYANSRVIARELTMPMLDSQILECDLSARFSVYLNQIV
jgi:hypothetical protein